MIKPYTINQSTKQSINQSIKQTINQSTNQPNKQTNKQTNNHLYLVIVFRLSQTIMDTPVGPSLAVHIIECLH